MHGSPRDARAQMREPAAKLVRPDTAAHKANVARDAAKLDTHANVAAPSAAQQRPQPAVDNTRKTVGLAPGAAQHAQSQAERQRFEQARRAPILRNPVFSSASNGAVAATAARGTFRGGFAESPLGGDQRHHQHRFGFVLGFVGPVFWPYAYTDLVDYTFSAYAYDTFWPYAFDDVYAGMFAGYAPEYYAADDVYAYAGAAASERSYARFAGPTPAPAPSAVTEARICTGQAQGIADFAIDKIAQQVQPDQKQQALLDQLKVASVKAVNIMQDACPTDLPSTPTGRLDGMATRVNAMLQAVQTVRPALDRFYHALNDEQRERFNALDQSGTTDRAQRTDFAKLCDRRAPSSSGLPTAQIERSLKLSSDQEVGLKALNQASAQAASTLKSKCDVEQTLTPTGRLAAMEDRLSAMAQALTTTRGALTQFYGSLNDEQKARFDRMRTTT
jgi:hypothetical protein